MAKLVLATSLLTSYGYLSEQTLSWYAGDKVEWYTYWFRLSGFGQYACITWTLFFCNTIVPQILWFQPLRRKESVLVIVSLLVLVGMWLERYMIITTSLSRDYLPSSWGFFKPTIWDIAHLCRLGRACSWSAFLLFARFAADPVDVGDAGVAARRARAGGGTMKPKTPIYGLMVEFLTAEEILDATRRARQAGYREMDAYTPYPVEGLAAELGMRKTRIPFVVLMGGLVGAGVGLLHAVLLDGDQLHVQRRRPALQQLAGVHSHHLRVADPGGGACGVLGNDVPQRPAAAASSGVQRAAVRPFQPGPFLPLHRGDRSAVRPPGDGGVSGHAQSARRGDRGAA